MGKLVYIGCFLLFSLTGHGQNEALFHKATEAYNKGDYDEAIALHWMFFIVLPHGSWPK